MSQELVDVFLEEAQDLLDTWERCVLDLQKSSDPERWNELFRAAHNLKGSSQSVGLLDFGRYVHRLEDLITALRTRPGDVGAEYYGLLLDGHAVLAAWSASLKSDPKATVRWDSRVIDEAREAFLRQEKTVHKNDVLANFVTDKPKTEKSDDTIRLPIQKLDALIRTIGELTIQNSMTRHALSNQDQRQLELSVEMCAGLIRELQELAVSVRLQTMGGLFQRLERVVGDVSRSLNKKVEARFEGGETELDRQIIEKIKDPLIHILRNSVDHGIESTDERLAAGKNETGRVLIKAEQTAGSVRITITDDGKGIDLERVRAKAIEKGLITADAVLSKADNIQLIFLPGFSTAKVVTDVSGRGVGMDVVRSIVEELQGSLEIDTEPGKGSIFMVSLPITLSIMDSLIVESRGYDFVIPIQDIQEILDLSAHTLENAGNGRSMLKFNDRILPVARLEEFIKIRSNTSADQGIVFEGKPGLVVQSTVGRAVICVDRIKGQQGIVTRPVSKQLAHVQCMAGATILPSGKAGFIVDIGACLRSIVKNQKGAVA